VGLFYEWNTDPTAIPGVLEQLSTRTGVQAKVDFKAIALDDARLFRNPFLMLTGSRAFRLSDTEIQNLRRYLQGGGSFTWTIAAARTVLCAPDRTGSARKPT